MERFAKIIKGFKQLTIFEKHSILYVGLASECLRMNAFCHITLKIHERAKLKAGENYLKLPF